MNYSLLLFFSGFLFKLLFFIIIIKIDNLEKNFKYVLIYKKRKKNTYSIIRYEIGIIIFYISMKNLLLDLKKYNLNRLK